MHTVGQVMRRILTCGLIAYDTSNCAVNINNWRAA